MVTAQDMVNNAKVIEFAPKEILNNELQKSKIESLEEKNKQTAINNEVNEKYLASFAFVETSGVKNNIPENYIVDQEGIFALKKNSKGDIAEVEKISGTPIVVKGILTDVDDNSTKVVLGFYANGGWHDIPDPIAKEDIASAPEATKILARYGVSIHTGVARKVCAYIVETIDANAYNEEVYQKQIVHKIGWKNIGGEKIFAIPMNEKANEKFVYTDAILNRFQSSNNIDEYEKALTQLFDLNVYTQLSILASLASPFLELTKVPNFTLYYWGRSGSAKTAIMQFALGAWCNPNGGNTMSFNSTTVGFERSLAKNNDIMTLFDERQSMAGNKQQQTAILEQLIYMVVTGVGKIRGAKNGGIRNIETFRTIVQGTGEEPIFSDSAKAGSINRCMEVKVGKILDREMARLAYGTCLTSYGDYGYYFLERALQLIKDSGKTPYELRVGILRYIRNNFKDIDEKADRQIESLSLLAMIDVLIRRIEFGDDVEQSYKHMNHFISEVINVLKDKNDIDDIGRGERALQDYLATNINSIVNVDDITTSRVSFGKVLGYKRKNGNETVYYLIISELKHFLEHGDENFNYRQLAEGLYEEGKVEKKNGRFSVQVNIKDTPIKGNFLIYHNVFEGDYLEVETNPKDDDEDVPF